MAKFNLSKYNLDKFNINSSYSSFDVTGITTIDVNSNVKNVSLTIYASKSNISINIDAKASRYIEVSNTGSTTINLTTAAIPTSFILYDKKLESDISIGTTAIGSLLGEEYIEISGFTLRSGESIEIDMCELTATIDGENVMHLLTPEGDFFDFLPGENNIEIVAQGADKVSIDTYWKDKWL